MTTNNDPFCYNAKFVKDVRFVKNNNITFKYAKGISDMNGKEFHAYHEIIFFMGGKATFISENIHTAISPNTLIVIPSETYHQLLITGAQDDYHRCVFHFWDGLAELEELISRSMNRVLVLDMNQQFQYLFDQMISLSAAPRIPKTDSVIMQSVLSLLLNELSKNSQPDGQAAKSCTISEKCITLISQGISGPITVTSLAQELNVSASHLSHTFKEQMNISVHQYILKKRLVMAHQKIINGEHATKAAMDCGFNDYSGFYKQFKKMFNKSPSCKEWDMVE